MDRDSIVRTIVAVVLSAGILIGWTYLFPAPKPAPAAPVATPAPAPAAGVPATPAKVEPKLEPGTAATTPPAVAAAVGGAENQPPFDVHSGAATVTFSARGARVMAWRLPAYPRAPGSNEAVDLVSTESRTLDRHALWIDLVDPALTKRIGDAWFAVDQADPPAADLAARKLPAGTKRVAFRWSDGAGVEITKAVYLPADQSYLARVEWSATRNGQPIPGATIAWGPGMGPQIDGNASNRYAYRGPAVVATVDGAKRIDPAKQTAALDWPAGGTPRWIALDEQYFAVALFPDRPQDAMAGVRPTEFAGAPKGQERQFALVSGSTAFTLFVGPKANSVLEAADARLGTNLSRLVDWGFWGFLAVPLYKVLSWIQGVVVNWGLAIVAITVLIRLAFMPLMHRSMVKMRVTQQAMAKIQPKIHKLKEKYKDRRDMDSRKAMNEEMMELYRKEGINPMQSLSGCLPMLLQMPVLFAMYSVLTVSIQLRGAPFFGWIGDLSAPDPIYITPIVMGATQLVQQVMTMTKTEDPQQRSQQRMMLIMPLMFTYFFISMPAGLVVYWLVNNVVGIGQQWLINRHANAPAPAR